ncbi:MAG TPA: RNA polymerase sigma factor [Ktedonobacterales bacterium]|nr:RNA polymerase sigma factor [Ktedonobacterales bacterium]
MTPIPIQWAALRVESPPAPRRGALVRLFRLLFATGALSGDTPSSSSSVSSQESRAAADVSQTGVDAFEAFFWRYERDILGYLWRLTGDEQAAYDLSQETFVRAWQRFESLQHYEQPRAWLFRVASNLGINHLRGRSRRGEQTAATEEIQNIVALGGDPAHRLAESDTIRRILGDLPPKQRAAVVLCDVYGLTSAEAAAALDLSHGSLKMSLWRGRERFRQEYQREGGAE